MDWAKQGREAGSFFFQYFLCHLHVPSPTQIRDWESFFFEVPKLIGTKPISSFFFFLTILGIFLKW
jgi:hypothetical protein